MADLLELAGSVIPSFLLVGLFYWILMKLLRRPLPSFLLAIPLAFVAVTFISAHGYADGNPVDYAARMPASLLSVMIASIIYLIGLWRKLTSF